MSENEHNIIPEYISQLQLLSSLDEVEKILTWWEKQDHSHIPVQIWLQSETVLIEGFTNAVRHAHQGLGAEILIELQLEITSQYLEIQIFDRGEFFDLGCALDNLQSQIESNDINLWERESQWGFIFVIKLRDEHGWTINYTQESDQRNCLKVRSPLF